MTWLLAAMALNSGAYSDVSEYFPLKVGTKWHYEEEGSYARDTDEVKAIVPIEGKDTVLIATTRNKRVIDTRYYRIEGDTLFLVANDPLDPIPTPQPILKYSGTKATWTYEGRAQFYRDWVKVAYKAQVVPKAKRNLFGADRECIELTVDATMEGAGGIDIVTRQVTTYAAGVGWVEMKQRQKIGSKTTESTTRLVKFEPAP